jgi:ribonuclease BN (tRNA processing enzyme)
MTQKSRNSASDALNLLFVGSSNAFAETGCWSGFLLNDRYLFDAPPSALYGLKHAGASLDALDVILISHFHGDHFFGLPFLLLEYAYATGELGRTSPRTRDLTIVGPPGIEEKVENLTALAYPNLAGRDLGFKRRYVELEPGCAKEVAGLRIEAEQMNHATDSLPLCLGYRVEHGGHRLAYTGDTAWTDALLELGHRADVFVTDCTYPSGFDLPEHLSLDEVAVLRGKLDETTSIILTHLGHGELPVGLSRTYRASDLMRFTLT